MPSTIATYPVVSPTRKPAPAIAAKTPKKMPAMIAITMPSMMSAPARRHQPASCQCPATGDSNGPATTPPAPGGGGDEYPASGSPEVMRGSLMRTTLASRRVQVLLKGGQHAHDAQTRLPVRARRGAGANALDEVLALHPQR